MKKIGFDNQKYLRVEKAANLERVVTFNNTLSLEFGGNLLYDDHAAGVMPGFELRVKMRLLRVLSISADIILGMHAGDIDRKKVKADSGTRMMQRR